MRIGTRITLTTSVLVAATLSAYAVISVRAHRSNLEAQLEGHAREIVAPLRVALEARKPTAWSSDVRELG